MLKKSSPPSAPATVDESFEDLVFLDEHECSELSYWEFINQSDADSDAESLHSVENGFVSWSSLSAPSRPKLPITDQEIQIQSPRQDHDLVDSVNSHDGGDQFAYHQREPGPVIFPGVGYRLHLDVDEEHYEEEEEEDDADDDNDDDAGYGLDDELVPWHVNGKLGRQRMRKLGKRVFSKMGSSKRNPYLFVKPGCVHGKHGLGIKARN